MWEAVVNGHASGSYAGAGLNRCWTGGPITIRMLHILDIVLSSGASQSVVLGLSHINF